MTWIAYVRNSENEPLALEAQATAIRSRLAAAGLGPVEIITDIGQTGGKRPGFAAMMRRAKAGEIAGVCAVSADRLAWRIVDFMEFTAVLGAAGVRLLLLTESLDTASPEGEVFLAITRAVAERDREFAALR